MSCTTDEELTFGSKDPESTELFTLDFVNLLASGETIVSADATLTVHSGGDDPDVGDMPVGIPAISGSKVSQMVTAGLDEFVYHLKIIATTSLGQEIPLCGYIPVQNC